MAPETGSRDVTSVPVSAPLNPEGRASLQARRLVGWAPGAGTGTSRARIRPVGSPLNIAGPLDQSPTTMNRVRRFGPPRAHEKQPSLVSTVCSTSPPSRTRTQWRLDTSAYQTAPSASRQMPSGAAASPRWAQTRRLARLPSAVMSNAVSTCAYDSATINVESSGVTAIPLGKPNPSAISRTAPSGVARAASPGRYCPPGKSNAMLLR